MSGLLLTHALAYAANGWPVLPLYAPVDGHCDCPRARSCSSPAKHPRTPNGLRDASTDPDVIRAWWATWPDANVGLAVPEDHVVVDLDIHDLGVLNGHAMPSTATAWTGRGWHYLYKTTEPIRPKVGILEHVDLRGPGSYIVAPPSRHVSGTTYEWWRRPGDGIADAPAWLYEAAPLSGTRASAVGEPIPEGGRNAGLASLAGVMRNRGMGEPAILAALLAENTARCQPPLPVDEVRSIAHSVAQYAPEEAGPIVVVGEPAPERPHARPASAVDPAAALEDCWLVEGVLRPGRLLVLASQEGVGKSYARKELALRLATGTGSLFGHYPIPHPVRVLLVDVENGDEEETRREEEVLDRLDIRRAALGDYWRVSLEGLSLAEAADQLYILDEVRSIGPGVVIFDTGSSMVADEWGRELKVAVRFLRGLARQYGCGVVVVVHLVKPNRQAKAKDAPEHGTELADVMGQWTRQADSVALMAATSAPDRIRWTMRKRVPGSMLILAPEGGTFATIQAIDGEELGAATRERVLRAIDAGETDRARIASTLGITTRQLRRHVSGLRQSGVLAPEDPLRVVSPDVRADVRPDLSVDEGTRIPDVLPDVRPDAVGGGHMSATPPIGGGGMSAPAVLLDVHAAGFDKYLRESRDGSAWLRVLPADPKAPPS
jgi:putative DNA primase/helicase